MTHEQSVAVPAESETGETACCARRSVLRGALALGAVGLGGALAGCGSKGSSDTASSGAPPVGSPASPMPSTSTGSDSATSAAPSAAASAGGSSSGTSLGSTSQVPVGGGNVYTGPKIVVTQPTAGTYKAFTAVCTHEQCTVGDVSGGTINCYCHGSKFSITDGSVVNGPAPSPLAAKIVTVSGSNITLNN